MTDNVVNPTLTNAQSFLSLASVINTSHTILKGAKAQASAETPNDRRKRYRLRYLHVNKLCPTRLKDCCESTDSGFGQQ